MKLGFVQEAAAIIVNCLECCLRAAQHITVVRSTLDATAAAADGITQSQISWSKLASLLACLVA